ncbi:hypothetical protein ACOME3_005103 [Neoechinorhynchus agilis]
MKVEFNCISRSLGSCRLSAFDKNGVEQSVIAALAVSGQRRSGPRDLIICSHSFGNSFDDTNGNVDESKRFSKIIEQMIISCLSSSIMIEDTSQTELKYVITVQHLEDISSNGDAGTKCRRIHYGFCINIALNAVYMALISAALPLKFSFFSGDAERNGTTMVAVFSTNFKDKLSPLPIASACFDTNGLSTNHVSVNAYFELIEQCGENARHVQSAIVEYINKDPPAMFAKHTVTPAIEVQGNQ